MVKKDKVVETESEVDPGEIETQGSAEQNEDVSDEKG